MLGLGLGTGFGIGLGTGSVRDSVRDRVMVRFRVCILMRSDDRFRKSVRARVRDTEVFLGVGSRLGAVVG